MTSQRDSYKFPGAFRQWSIPRSILPMPISRPAVCREESKKARWSARVRPPLPLCCADWNAAARRWGLMTRIMLMLLLEWTEFRLPSRTREHKNAQGVTCISPRSALARSQARTYVRTFTQRETQMHARTHARTHAPTHAHVQSLNAALGSSVEATNTLQRINRITAPPSIRSPPFCHDDMYVCIARVLLRNNVISRRLS